MAQQERLPNSLGRLQSAGNTTFVGSGARVWALQVGKGQVVGGLYKKSKKISNNFQKGIAFLV